MTNAMSMSVLVLHVLLLFGTGGMLIGLFLLRGAVVQGFSHRELDKITAMLGELQLGLSGVHGMVATMEQEIRRDLDSLHERLEYLEQRDRERRE